MKKHRLSYGMALFVVIGLMVACNGRGPSTENNNNSIEMTEIISVENESGAQKVVDTVDLDTYLKKFDDFAASLKEIHIKTIADTVLISNLEKETKSIRVLSPNVDLENATHSERVRVYQSLLACLNECLRISEEMKRVGISDDSKFMMDEAEEQNLKEFVEQLQKELDRELN